ncbi:hypothetical protein [Rhizobium bangladeshense]|uniref:hypothetical protein n=1 Tax=Rhizobium bangladeshense TaxID=1138189 RepID=UPI0007E5497B|nr:hypothetical protein [Rhizobium bangladeshense]
MLAFADGPLERAVEHDPAYARAHGNAAMCRHGLSLRAGLQKANRATSIHYARAAILHGHDDATAWPLQKPRQSDQSR